MTRIIFLSTLTLWTLAAQTSGTSVTTPVLGQVYDASTGSVLVFTGSPGTARVRLKPGAVVDASCTLAVSAALWFCVAPDGQVSVAPADGSSPQMLDVPAGPNSLVVSDSGAAAVLWYAKLGRLYLVTGAASAIRVLEPAAPLTKVLAVRDDGAMVLARGNDGCAWLVSPDDAPRCVQTGDGEISGAFAAGPAVLLACRRSGKVYLAQAGAYNPELLVGPGDGIVEPVAVLGAGRQVFVADRGARVIHAIDLDTRAIRPMESPAPPSRFVPMGAGLYLTTGWSSGSLILLQTGPAARIAAAVLDPGGDQ